MTAIPPARYATAILLCIASAMVTSGAQQTHGTERTVFHEDKASFDPSLKVSADVLQALSEQPEAGYLRDTKPDHPEQFFQGAKIHLTQSTTGKPDLVVLGDPPLTGADQAWFWLIRSADNHPKVLLFLPGNAVRLLATYHHGYRDVVSAWASPNERITKTFRYDGHAYTLFRTKDKILAPEP